MAAQQKKNTKTKRMSGQTSPRNYPTSQKKPRYAQADPLTSSSIAPLSPVGYDVDLQRIKDRLSQVLARVQGIGRNAEYDAMNAAVIKAIEKAIATTLADFPHVEDWATVQQGHIHSTVVQAILTCTVRNHLAQGGYTRSHPTLPLHAGTQALINVGVDEIIGLINRAGLQPDDPALAFCLRVVCRNLLHPEAHVPMCDMCRTIQPDYALNAIDLFEPAFGLGDSTCFACQGLGFIDF